MRKRHTNSSSNESGAEKSLEKPILKTPNSRQRKKKKAPVWLRILVIVLGVLVLSLMVVMMYVLWQLDKINQAEDIEALSAAEEYFETDESSMYDAMNPGDVEWSSDESVNGEDDVINILLIGQDRRPGESRARSDSMIIATINKTDNTISLTSLMRDMYVQIPGYSDNRINAAYAFGGMALLDETIKQNFDIDIDGNIEVDFSGFEQVINILGGVDIELSQAEVNEVNRTSASSYISSAGLQHLNGAQALAYARIRNIGNSDFGRTSRQRTVLTAAYAKVRQMKLSDMLSLADTVLPLITTDQSGMALVGLATDIFGMGVSSLETHNIPEDASFQSANIRGMDVLVPNLDDCRRTLRSIIYGE